MTPQPLRYNVTLICISLIGMVTTACQTNAPRTQPEKPQPTPIVQLQPDRPLTAEAARNLANNCFTCHGPNGRSPGTIPSIDTLNAADLATRMKNFKRGITPATVMGRHARGYSDAEIDAVSAYIASLNRR